MERDSDRAGELDQGYHERAAESHDRAAGLHQRSAKLHDEHAVEMRELGDGPKTRRALQIAARERELVAKERRLADAERAESEVGSESA